MTQPFADDPTRMVATGGAIRAVNGSRVVYGRIVRVGCRRRGCPRIQVVEYLRAFLLGRTGWSRLGALILISGAFGMFRRDVVVEVGGLDPDSIGEDFELVMRIHKQARDQRRDYRVEFVPEPVSWTEVPVTAGCCAASGGGGTAGSGRRCGRTAGCCSARVRPGRLVALPYYWLFELFAPAARARPASSGALGLRARCGQRVVRLRLPRCRLRLRRSS